MTLLHYHDPDANGVWEPCELDGGDFDLPTVLTAEELDQALSEDPFYEDAPSGAIRHAIRQANEG